jgi:hypothetical protein
MLKITLVIAALAASTVIAMATEPTEPFADRAIKTGDRVCASQTGKKLALCRRDFINLALEPYLVSKLAFSATVSADSIGDESNDNYYAEALTGDTVKFDAKLDALVRTYQQ